MTRTIALGLLLGAVALPAFAETSITVNVAKLDARTAHVRIVEAAEKACRVEFASTSALDQHYGLRACVDESTAAAEAELAHKSNLAKL